MGLVGKVQYELKNIKTGKVRRGERKNMITPLGKAAFLVNGIGAFIGNVTNLRGQGMAVNLDTGCYNASMSNLTKPEMAEQVLFTGLGNMTGKSHVTLNSSNVLARAKNKLSTSTLGANEGYRDLTSDPTNNKKLVGTSQKVMATYVYPVGCGTGQISHVGMTIPKGFNVMTYLGYCEAGTNVQMTYVPAGWLGVPEGYIGLNLGSYSSPTYKLLKLEDFSLSDWEPYGTYTADWESFEKMTFVRFDHYLINLFQSYVFVYDIDTDTTFRIQNTAYQANGCIVSIEQSGGFEKLYVSYCTSTTTTSISNWRCYEVTIGVNNVTFTQVSTTTDHLANQIVSYGFKWGAYVTVAEEHKYIMSKEQYFTGQLYMIDSVRDWDASYSSDDAKCNYNNISNSLITIYDNYILLGCKRNQITYANSPTAICSADTWGNLFSIFELSETKASDDILTLTYIFEMETETA